MLGVISIALICIELRGCVEGRFRILAEEFRPRCRDRRAADLGLSAVATKHIDLAVKDDIVTRIVDEFLGEILAVLQCPCR